LKKKKKSQKQPLKYFLYFTSEFIFNENGILAVRVFCYQENKVMKVRNIIKDSDSCKTNQQRNACRRMIVPKESHHIKKKKKKET
jgi:hypothetical protein